MNKHQLHLYTNPQSSQQWWSLENKYLTLKAKAEGKDLMLRTRTKLTSYAIHSLARIVGSIQHGATTEKSIYVQQINKQLSFLVYSKGILSDISLICQLNCYQKISSPICLQRCVVTCIKMLKLNSCGKCWKKFVKVEVSLSEVLLTGCKWCSLALRKGEGWGTTRAAISHSDYSNLTVTEVEC